MRDVRDALMVGRSSDGKLVRRPLSPHLQVYKPQITTVLSILHRISGVALAAGTLFLVCWLAAGASGPAWFETVQGFAGTILGQLLLFGWTVALFYHLFSGLRHLAWDMGLGFEKAQYTASGWAVVITTTAASLLAWIIGYAVR
ncbi:MAG: succinate dehydrogenase, cytochrome b556 subunit [Acetobacteraceae bacterium]|nr:succinate dehydrogenase, cytochrome b556 subunit [Acetobacteraceae bacterium]MSP30932.1 succinate dehydrogenase, cytochrome b556 subunit [Acetobacteraceae bacterium]